MTRLRHDDDARGIFVSTNKEFEIPFLRRSSHIYGKSIFIFMVLCSLLFHYKILFSLQ